uniref:Killer cell lectin like receptor F1 n=1 Tax=Loxodonta africana TaxID=9785 RepID=G3UIX9_LOXAF
MYQGTFREIQLLPTLLPPFSSVIKNRKQIYKDFVCWFVMIKMMTIIMCVCMSHIPQFLSVLYQKSQKCIYRLCPSEWLKYQEKCYWFSNELKSWSDSYGYCSDRKSHLLIIQDQLEMAFIQKNLRQSNYVWIGLNVTSLKKTWTWVDGS